MSDPRPIMRLLPTTSDPETLLVLFSRLLADSKDYKPIAAMLVELPSDRRDALIERFAPTASAQAAATLLGTLGALDNEIGGRAEADMDPIDPYVPSPATVSGLLEALTEVPAVSLSRFAIAFHTTLVENHQLDAVVEKLLVQADAIDALSDTVRLVPLLEDDTITKIGALVQARQPDPHAREPWLIEFNWISLYELSAHRANVFFDSCEFPASLVWKTLADQARKPTPHLESYCHARMHQALPDAACWQRFLGMLDDWAGTFASLLEAVMLVEDDDNTAVR